MRRHARAGYWSMVLSAVVMAVVGLGILIVPGQVLTMLFGATADAVNRPLLACLGALYLGFAGVNWMARGQMLGGIYGRPICLGNLYHFSVGTLALVFQVLTGEHALASLVLGGAYLFFMLIFIRLTFRMPTVAEHL